MQTQLTVQQVVLRCHTSTVVVDLWNRIQLKDRIKQREGKERARERERGRERGGGRTRRPPDFRLELAYFSILTQNMDLIQI